MARKRDTATAEAEAPQEQAEAPAFEVEFIDELPTIERKRDSGVWVERLAPLAGNPGKWGKVYPTGEKPPHPTVNMLKSGKAAGVDPSDYEFAGRVIDGQGFVLARLLTDEQKAERDAQSEAEGTASE